MLELFTGLYVGMQTLAVLMAWPQIRKLYLAKQSSELSLTTWATWLMSSFVTMSYAFLTEQFIWMSANIAWAVFYTVMVVMIIRYRRQTIYEQMVELFRMRFYFSVGKGEAAPDSPSHGFFSKFRKHRD